jgi:hypothetical protein
MTRICNFPTSKKERCKQPIADDKPNCGRHRIDLSADQLGQDATIYEKDDELHVWAGNPDGLYCLIHNDPANQVLYQLAGEKPPCCLQSSIAWRDDHGKYHREDGPARIDLNGTQYWYWHGWLHREDGPAEIELNGTQKWYRNGKQHRDDGPAEIEPDGTQRWYQNDKRHRDDGPAAIGPDGTQAWYQNDECHREDGPALIRADGTQYWYWHGKQVPKEEHDRLREQSRGA